MGCLKKWWDQKILQWNYRKKKCLPDRFNLKWQRYLLESMIPFGPPDEKELVCLRKMLAEYEEIIKRNNERIQEIKALIQEDAEG